MGQSSKMNDKRLIQRRTFSKNSETGFLSQCFRKLDLQIKDHSTRHRGTGHRMKLLPLSLLRLCQS
jgi:hypothetical protein